MLSSSQGLTIHGGRFTNVSRGDYVQHIQNLVENEVHYHGEGTSNEARKQEALKRLFEHIAPGALHNSAERHDPPKCHPDTRQAIQQSIMAWLKDSRNLRLLMWIYGPAGSGKSAIMQSIAELCEQEGFLGGAFFFFWTSAKRNIKDHLIATLAYQLAMRVPCFGDHLAAALLNDPSILSQTLATQMQKLIVNPINVAFSNNPNICHCQWLYLLLIDGLDECGPEESHREIISLLSESVSFPFRIIIASRPECVIRETFSRLAIQSQTETVALHDEYQADEDIDAFFRSTFYDIKSNHPFRHSISDIWPSEEIICKLVQAASGQFIYAATVLKYIDSPRHNPVTLLDQVLATSISVESNRSPFAQLDALYHQILSSVQDIDQVLCIVYCLCMNAADSGIYRRPEVLEQVLGLSKGEIRCLLCDMHSLVFIPDVGKRGDCDVYHASLQDYLLDQRRSGIFWRQPGEVDTQFVTKVLRNYGNGSHMFDRIVYQCLVHPLLDKLLPTPELLSALFEFNIFNHFDIHLLNLDTKNLQHPGLEFMTVFWSFKSLQKVWPSSEWINRIYRKWVDNLDVWMSDIVQHSKWDQSKVNLLFNIICDMYLGTVRAIADDQWIRIHEQEPPPRPNWPHYRITFWKLDIPDEVNGKTLIDALKEVSSKVHRHTYQAIQSSGCLDIWMMKFTDYYMELWPKLMRASTMVGPVLEADELIQWTRHMRHLLSTMSTPRIFSRKFADTTFSIASENGLQSRDLLVDLSRSNFSFNINHICGLMNGEVECSSTTCRVKGDVIAFLKQELHLFALEIMGYTQMYNQQVHNHAYNAQHFLCIRCLSTQAFLEDQEYLQQAVFNMGGENQYFERGDRGR